MVAGFSGDGRNAFSCDHLIGMAPMANEVARWVVFACFEV